MAGKRLDVAELKLRLDYHVKAASRLRRQIRRAAPKPRKLSKTAKILRVADGATTREIADITKMTVRYVKNVLTQKKWKSTLIMQIHPTTGVSRKSALWSKP